jgi:hypothetical protein
MVENSMAVPQKVKHRITSGFSNSNSTYIPKKIEQWNLDTSTPILK